jgi:hypothetical protein
MSITVIIARDEVGAPTTREVYENGVKFSTENGDLSIVSAKPQLLATYGSGNWLSVHVDDAVQVLVDRPDDGGDSGDFGDSFGDLGGDSDLDFSSDVTSEDSDPFAVAESESEGDSTSED